MRKSFLLYLLPFASCLLMLTSCEVEFSPNAEWKEVPVIYCLLDQDDDTTWARVEKCYLGDGNIYDYSSVSDSFNYPEGAIQVALLGYDAANTLVDSIPFSYTLAPRDSGAFASEGQPVYAARTRNRLASNCTYRISVRHTADGSLLARSQPVSLVVQTATTVISRPTNTGSFGFYDHNGSSTSFCRIEWPALQGARLYQPMVRFYYEVGGDTVYLDLRAGTVRASSGGTTYGVYYSRDVFLAAVREALKDDPRLKHYVSERTDIYLHAASEELNAYMNTAATVSNLEQSHEVYTNIEGGLGVVAARRLHLFKRVRSDDSLNERTGLYPLLKQLGINME